jgi:hypothetical protein
MGTTIRDVSTDWWDLLVAVPSTIALVEEFIVAVVTVDGMVSDVAAEVATLDDDNNMEDKGRTNDREDTAVDSGMEDTTVGKEAADELDPKPSWLREFPSHCAGQSFSAPSGRSTEEPGSGYAIASKTF